MSNILIHMLVNQNSEYDIFSITDYSQMSETFRKQNISCPNLGNRLWFQGLISEISESGNTLTYFNESMSKEYINDTFDMIVAPMANVFHPAFSDLLWRLSERFKGIHIPVYVIACGVQSDSFDSLDVLCASIKQPAQAFLKSVYNTGGEFALRGYFSKEFFDRMGFSSAVVTGCPSLYQLGRDLQISNEKIDIGHFKPILNGNTTDCLCMAKGYPNSEFFDQERFFHILHDPYYTFNVRSLIHLYGYNTTLWLLSEKVKMIPNMNDWRNYLQSNNFTFSYGSRIHGSIMPILSGIPAAINPLDARTREMAEFFDIPIITRKKKTLYDLYLETDYTDFNNSFSKKYDAYENFLISHGIVKKCNTQNAFFAEANVDVTAGNHLKLKEMKVKFKMQQMLWKGYESMLSLKRSIYNIRK